MTNPRNESLHRKHTFLEQMLAKRGRYQLTICSTYPKGWGEAPGRPREQAGLLGIRGSPFLTQARGWPQEGARGCDGGAGSSPSSEIEKSAVANRGTWCRPGPRAGLGRRGGHTPGRLCHAGAPGLRKDLAACLQPGGLAQACPRQGAPGAVSREIPTIWGAWALNETLWS